MGQTFHFAEQFLVTHVLDPWLLADKRHCPSWLQDALFDFGERGEPLLVGRGLQLRHSDQFLLQMLCADFSVFDQDIGPSFDHLVELPVIVEKSHDQIIGDQKGSGADDSPHDGVVVADDGVLHGVGQRQKHDEVERV